MAYDHQSLYYVTKFPHKKKYARKNPQKKSTRKLSCRLCLGARVAIDCVVHLHQIQGCHCNQLRQYTDIRGGCEEIEINAAI